MAAVKKTKGLIKRAGTTTMYGKFEFLVLSMEMLFSYSQLINLS